jgi:hypothetical protein
VNCSEYAESEPDNIEITSEEPSMLTRFTNTSKLLELEKSITCIELDRVSPNTAQSTISGEMKQVIHATLPQSKVINAMQSEMGYIYSMFKELRNHIMPNSLPPPPQPNYSAIQTSNNMNNNASPTNMLPPGCTPLVARNMYLEGATQNLKGDDKAYKYASHSVLGDIFVYARFFYSDKNAFTCDPCFMVITLPSTGIDRPALTLTSDKVWGNDKLLHLSRLPVTDTGEDPLIPVRGMVGSECLSGLYPTPIRGAILNMPLFWCMNGEFTFLVGSAPHSTSSDDEIMG